MCANSIIVFEDSSPQFRLVFGTSVFKQLMEKAIYTLPAIPPQSHTLNPLSDGHLLKIEIIKLATVVVKSVSTQPPNDMGKRFLDWIQAELDVHTKESQQFTYPLNFAK